MNDVILLDKLQAGSLDEYEVASVDLSHEYWTPVEVGEQRRMRFVTIQNRMCPSHDDPDKEVELECAIFLDGERAVCNASSRLVATFKNTTLESGTPVQITYQGKKKNRTNGNQSDHWSVQTLKPRGGKK